jgi:hypothetical protein
METIVKGTTLKLKFSVSADSVTVYVAGVSKFSGNAVLTDGSFVFIYDTSNLAVGDYSWEAFAVKDGIKTHLLRSGFRILESLSNAPLTNYDTLVDKSHNEKMVEMIEAMLAGNASAGVKSYQINNRRLDRYGIDELLKLLNYYKNDLAKEKRRKMGKSVLGPRIEFRI